MKKEQKSNKLLLLILIMFIILIILLITMWPFKSYKIKETKTFSEIPRFSLEHPIFEGWDIKEIKKINENEYVIFFNYPSNIQFEVAPQMNIKKINEIGLDYLSDTKNHSPIGGIPTLNAKKNKNNVLYDYLEYPSTYTLQFYNKDFGVRIVPFMHEGNGYSGKVLVKTIIENFKLSETKTFSEIPGFNFEYQVFEEWDIKEIKKINETEYIIFFNYPDRTDFYIPPQIKIIKTSRKTSDHFGEEKNPNGSYYIFNEKSQLLIFSNSNTSIKIDFSNIPNKNGFQKSLFINKIIESFKFK